MEREKTTEHSETIAFTEAYDAHAERIYRYHFYRIRHKETAEDLTSKTFMKALENFHRFDRRKASMSTWLYRIARNTLIDHVRATRPDVNVEDAADLIASPQNAERDTDNRRAFERVRDALGSLTPVQRETVILRLWDGLSYAEIAEATGRKEGACKMAFSRGIATLRQHVGPLAIIFLVLSISSSTSTFH